MATISTTEPTKIILYSVEAARLVINAPNAHVDLYLKSVEHLSLVNCHSANIYLTEDFDGCNVFDVNAQKFHV